MAAELDVDAIIDKLLDVKSARPGKQVNLTEAEIKGLCKTSREVFMSQPILLELEAPIKICGASLAALCALSGRAPHQRDGAVRAATRVRLRGLSTPIERN